MMSLWRLKDTTLSCWITIGIIALVIMYANVGYFSFAIFFGYFIIFVAASEISYQVFRLIVWLVKRMRR